ncbi:MAG: 2-succinyl-5-enolpyruvyl-6-hydroxy-3-cyclohexene-1-carboxylic-acid synthase [Myxococcota bacterium]
MAPPSDTPPPVASPVADAPNRNLAVAHALFEEWERAVVTHVCVCPGSRSAPLAIAAAQAALPHSVHLDERSAAFFALGVAKASRAPAIVLCTSGTAAANFAPAVVEAHYARVPLLVLTADRPPELRDWGAGQTIDQPRLYGSHVRWFAEAPLPEADEAGLRYARALACRAAEVASGTVPGPVHLNLPFRDPLDPRPVPADRASPRSTVAESGRDRSAYARVEAAAPLPNEAAFAGLVEQLRTAERGVVVVGPLDATPRERDALVALADRLGWPLLGEATAQLGGAGIGRAHALMADPDFAAAHRPDAVLRFGAAPTSKPIAHWLRDAAPDVYVVVDPAEHWHDPDHRASEWWQTEIAAFADTLASQLPKPEQGTWQAAFARADAAADRVLEATLAAEEELLEARVAHELIGSLGPEDALYVSSSMPVRDLDQFWPSGHAGPRVLCNRGANGIDGLISSAAGATHARGGRTVLYVGDLACLHDLSGLLTAQRLGLPLTLVVVDNDGGGIFSMLPVAAFGDAASFEEVFHTPHGHDLVRLSEAAGVPSERITSWLHLRSALKQAAAAEGPRCLVVPTRAAASVEQRRTLQAAMHEAAREASLD